MNLDDDFFGYNLHLSNAPVDFTDIFSDLYEDRSTGVSEQPSRKDLSNNGGYIPISLSTEFYPESGGDLNIPPVDNKSGFKVSKLNKLFWKCGISLITTASILFFCNLAIAERSGDLNGAREHHLISASNLLTPISLLTLIGVFAGMGKVEKLIGVSTDDKSNQ